MRWSYPMPSATSRTSASTVLAEVGDRVHERDLGREERVRRVLDHLGRRRVGDEHRRVDRPVQLADPHGHRGIVTPDDHAVRLEEVAHGGALAQELGVRRDADLLDRARPPRRGCAAPARVEPTGIVDLLITTVPGRSTGAISRATVLDEREVGRAVVAPAASGRRGTRTRRCSPRSARRRRTSAGGTRGPRRRSAGSPSSRIGISPLDSAADPFRVDVGARHPVAEVGQAGRRGQPDVAGADDRNITHGSDPLSRRPRALPAL